MLKQIQKKLSSPDSLVSLILGLAVVLVIGTLAVNYFKGKKAVTTKPETTSQTQPVSLPSTHSVLEGETLWSIAETYYKSGYNWVSIRDANSLTNPDAIEVGQTLTIPKAEVISPAGQISATSIEAKPPTYTVAHGDDLWHIAIRFYGSGYKWADISQANQLVNPDLIHAGNVLTLP